MEHLQHFGLAQDPFQNEPDLRFYFDSQSHSAVQCRLDRALRQAKGLSVLSGDGGTGKTLLARRIFESLEEEVFEAHLMVMMAGAADATTVLKRYARQLGVEELAEDRSQMLAQIYEKVAIVREEGRHSLLILDDAHVLSAETLAELGGLLNLEYEERRLISLLLVGRPELDETLSDASLSQRVDARAPLGALDLANSGAYISHRIRQVGGNPIIIPQESVEVLHKIAEGRPRLLNTLADNALFEAFLAGRHQIHPGDVERAGADLGVVDGGAMPPAAPPPAPDPAAPAAVPTVPVGAIPPPPVAEIPAPAASTPTGRIPDASAAGGAIPAAVPLRAPRPPAVQPLAAQPAPPPRTAAAPAANPPAPAAAPAAAAEPTLGEYTDPGAGPALSTSAPAASDDFGDLLESEVSDDLAEVLGGDAVELDPMGQPMIELDAEIDGLAQEALPSFNAPQSPPGMAPVAEATRVAFDDEPFASADSTADEIDDLFVELVED